nr:uncharacterized protein LOC112037926 [Quercus suber]
MDDLTGKWARLSLNTRETQTIPLAPEVENNNRVLVAKLFTKRRVNIEALSRTLKTMWRSIQNFEVRDLTSNTVLILFSNEVDAKKILSQGPWSFDKYLIGLYKPSESESVDDAKFDTASFWVQIHNLPLSRMNRANAEIIGSSLGKVEQVDASPTGECRGRCVRIRVALNIEQPLCRGRFVDMGATGPLWVSFQYERMPVFCYWCGLMNHDEKDCQLWTDSGETLEKESQQYGPWLRATMANPQQTQVVHTKTPPPTAPPSTQRPTPSPITRPLPAMERAHNLAENPPSLSKNDNPVISATYPETTPTNKEILSDPILFRTHITEIDHALNSFQNSNQQTLLTQLDTTPATNTPAPPSPYTPKSTNSKKNTSDSIVTHVTTTLPITDHALHSFQNSHQPSLHPQLANTPATYSQPSLSPCLPKSGITKTETNAAKVTHVTDTMPPITNHDIHAIHQNSNSSITSTPLDLVGPKQSSWRRLGPPRHIMDASGTCDHMSGSKRKSSEEVIMEDSFDEKKQKLLNEEARTLGKLMADNLGSAVAAWQHRRTQ